MPRAEPDESRSLRARRRPGPTEPADEHRGAVAIGNDGLRWRSRAGPRGVFVWRREPGQTRRSPLPKITRAARRAARPSPRQPARAAPGASAVGNDGRVWVSRANRLGVYAWRRARSPARR